MRSEIGWLASSGTRDGSSPVGAGAKPAHLAGAETSAGGGISEDWLRCAVVVVVVAAVAFWGGTDTAIWAEAIAAAAAAAAAACAMA